MQKGMKLLDINVQELDRRLKEQEAVRWPDIRLRRHVYVQDENNYFKLRDEGNRVVLDIHRMGKRQVFRLDAGFEKASVLLHDLGHRPTAYHELKNTFYMVGPIMVDIVKWPRIPPYAEFTGPERRVRRLIQKLGYSLSNISRASTKELFKLYGIDLEKQTQIKF